MSYKSIVSILALMAVFCAVVLHYYHTPSSLRHRFSDKEKPKQQLNAKKAEKIFVRDFDGKEKSITLPVERVVLLTGPAVLKMVRILDASSKVVGVSDIAREDPMLFPSLSKLPVVAKIKTGVPDFEAIIALKPDLVLATFWIDKELENLLEPDIQVARFDIGPPLRYTEDLRTLGRILDNPRKAEELISWYEKEVNEISVKLAKIGKEQYPRVFDFYGGEWGLSSGPPYGTYGKNNSWVNPTIEMAGGISVSAALEGDWIVVDPEYVIVKDPDIIVREVLSTISGKHVVGYDAVNDSGMRKIYDSIANDPLLSSTKAVGNKRVHLIEGAIIQTEWFLALQYMVKWFHPEVFSDLDPEKMHKEYLSRFQRLSYDFDEKGVFAFPDK